jgi:hypothetical protein
MRCREQARAGVIILVSVSFLLGLAASALWHYRNSLVQRSAQVDESHHELSDSSKAMLKGLTSTVEIRFYALLDPTSTSESLGEFARRADQLLSEYEKEAGEKLAVKRFKALSVDADAASTDGLIPFNFDQGDPCFLGMVITCNDQKESFGRLLPQWEAALESDLTRAIERVAAVKPAGRSVAVETRVSADVLKEVKQLIPNTAEVSLESGTQMLRDAGMTEFQEAMKEGEKQIEEATRLLVQANSTGSEVERQDALKRIQRVQTEQTEKLSRISERLLLRIAAFEELKHEKR